jgi:multidrug efflux pump subunit AcrA (membrane-fusion protein)
VGESSNTVSPATITKESGGRKSSEPVIRMLDVVFVVDGEHVKMAPVKTGISDENYWEITDGLKEGDEIVSGGPHAISHDLEDGKKITKETAAEAAKPPL